MIKRNILFYLTFILLIFGCSKDDNSNDKIIGDWQVIEAYQYGILRDHDDCWQYYLTSFKIDNSGHAGFVNLENTPVECANNVNFSLFSWRNIGNNSREIVVLNEILGPVYFEGENLIIEGNSILTKRVLIRL